MEVSVDFGKWNVSEIQLCELGSRAPGGEYLSVGRVELK